MTADGRSTSREWTGLRRARRQLTLSELAGHLDRRLHGPTATQSSVAVGCALAVQTGVAAVICQPEHVGVAAAEVAGTPVTVATSLASDRLDHELVQLQELRAEAGRLVEQGVHEVALIATRERLSVGNGAHFVDQVAALTRMVEPAGVHVRVVLATEEMSTGEIAVACRQFADAGAWMVQGGSWRGRRTTLTQIETMRAALPPHVLLKWTEPVKAVETLLLCISFGVDRFNTDVAALMAQAARRTIVGPLEIPQAGIDY